LQEREPEAFQELFQEMFMPLCRYANRYLYSPGDAEDMVQDAFLNLWLHAKEIQLTRDVRVYLSVAVKNACLNHLRHLHIRDSHQDKIVEATIFSGLPETEPDPVISARVQAVLDRLPPRARLVVTEHLIHQRPVNDIAKELQLAPSTVKTHLKRAMKTLRNSLLSP
jgi:RNA polymerase sigma-70 factor (ECF subfamily)